MALPVFPDIWVCVGGLFFLGSLLLAHFLPSLMHSNLPMGSFGWPLLGETMRFLQPHSSVTLGNFLEDHCSKYGKIFKSHLFFSPTIVSCDQELNNFILQNEGRLFQASYPKPVHGVLGENSLLLVVGDTHKRLRTMAVALVSATKAKAEYLSELERMATHVMTQWKGKDEVCFCDEARKFSFGVIVKQVMGLSPSEPTAAIILRDFRTYMKGLISFPLYIPGLPYAQAVQARTRISSIVRYIIEERARIRGDSNLCRGDQDYLDVLISTSNLSEEEKVGFVLDSLLGGYETTTLLLAMAVHFLGQCPAALDQVMLEHRTIRAKRDENQPLSWDDYKKMEFTQNVISEALRCGNIVKFVHRKALKDVRFGDYLIPSGWKVLPVLSAVHVDPSLHRDAFSFNPWRWEDQSQAGSKKFIPFGGGTRLCPGSELARVETAVFLHHFLLNFRWSPAEKDGPLAYPYVEFPKGLPLKVEPFPGK